MKFKNTRTKYIYFNINKLKFHIFENRENKIAFKQKNYYTLCNKIEDSLYWIQFRSNKLGRPYLLALSISMFGPNILLAYPV